MHKVGHASDLCRGDDRQSGAHCLVDRQAPGFVFGREHEDIARGVNARQCRLIYETREVDVGQPEAPSQPAQLCLHLARADHSEMEDNALSIEPGGGAQQIVGTLPTLEFGGEKYDRAVIMDAKLGAQLLALGVRQLRPRHKALVVDCVGHIEDQPIWHADRPVEFAVRRADREDAVEPAVIGPDQPPPQQVFERRPAQAEMRLAAQERSVSGPPWPPRPRPPWRRACGHARRGHRTRPGAPLATVRARLQRKSSSLPRVSRRREQSSPGSPPADRHPI